MSKGNPFLALRLSRDQQDMLRAKATESGISLSELVRQAVAGFARMSPNTQAGTGSNLRRQRKQSRPARLQSAISEIEDLLSDYENWQANLPESLQETQTAAMLNEAVDTFQQVVDLLQEITVPRGFGRD